MSAKKALVMLAGAAAVFLGWYFLKPKTAAAAALPDDLFPAPLPPAQTGAYKKPAAEAPAPSGSVDFGDITFTDPSGKVTGTYKTPDF